MVILCRRVGIETAGAFQRHLEQWREVTELLGLSHGSNALYRYSLAPGSKAMMVYAEAIAAHGERKLTLNVRRAHVFEDAWRALHSQGTLRGQPGSHKVFPSFFSVENGHQVFEHGEGHGPRKEFFLLAGSEAAAEEGRRHRLLSYNRTAGCYWLETHGGDPSAASDELRSKYEALGWLMASAVTNRASMRLPLPTVLFEKLLEAAKFQAGLAKVLAFDPAALTDELARTRGDLARDSGHAVERALKRGSGRQRQPCQGQRLHKRHGPLN